MGNTNCERKPTRPLGARAPQYTCTGSVVVLLQVRGNAGAAARVSKKATRICFGVNNGLLGEFVAGRE